MNRDFAFDLKEASGALGDLGTLLPLTIAAVALGGLAPVPVLLGFAAFYVFSAFVYRLPVPVQPMKAMVAVMLITQVPPARWRWRGSIDRRGAAGAGCLGLDRPSGAASAAIGDLGAAIGVGDDAGAGGAAD